MNLISLKAPIQEALQERLAAHTTYTSEYACSNEEIIRKDASDYDAQTLIRPAFRRDVEKIINLFAYARYADKTQVFSFLTHDDISRRSLHVQLVAHVAQNIGRLLGLNLDLIEAIALGHDLGHTPFGHAGERFLSKVYHRETGKYFNHNIQSVRVLDTLTPRNISLQTLNGILSHNGEFALKTLRLNPMESFQELNAHMQACNEDETLIASLRPSTLEGCVVRVSDMIAYIGKDRQDALEMGFIPSLDIFDSDYLGTSNREIIHNMTVDIVNESFGKPYIALSEQAFLDLKRAKRQNYDLIYSNEGVLDNAHTYIESIFEKLYYQIREDLETRNQSSAVYKSHLAYLARKSQNFDLEEYLSQDKNVITCDFIASMTDTYFMRLYKKLFE